ncbi:hypothetical protein VNO80_07598 [Phaseolus coccineus]|uniref:Uncharacterized protein n=1 Tax=Phaseolus coccineus TaxID=3886 RepID=A0AAN9NJZ1_PHACN
MIRIEIQLDEGVWSNVKGWAAAARVSRPGWCASRSRRRWGAAVTATRAEVVVAGFALRREGEVLRVGQVCEGRCRVWCGVVTGGGGVFCGGALLGQWWISTDLGVWELVFENGGGF